MLTSRYSGRLVGLAAAFTAAGDFMTVDPSHASTFHNLST
jgi:hypothetical protein